MVRDRLQLSLFGEDLDDGGGNYLHVTLHRLRRLLRRQTQWYGEWVSVREGMVVLNENLIERVDIEEYRKMTAVGHQLWPIDREAACDLYTRAVTLYHPTIAPEFEYEDLFSETRIFLEQQQRRMLKRLWDEEKRMGRVEDAVHRGEQLLALDPMDLSVLEWLCSDWSAMGDRKTMQQACSRSAQMLHDDGESIPEWLEVIARGGKSTDSRTL